MTRTWTRYVLEFPPPARHPLVVVLALASVSSGLGILLGSAAPGSTARLLPHPLLTVWAFGLVATGAAFLLAALWRDVITGVLIEFAACILGFLATTAYVIGAVTVLPAGVVLPIAVTGAYGLGCLVRAIQIVRGIRRGQRRLHEIAQQRQAGATEHP